MHVSLLTGQATPRLLRSAIGTDRDDRSLTAAPWRVLGQPQTVELRNPRRRQLRGLPPGTPVCLVLDGPGARLRLRRAARRAGVVLERELIAVPSTGHPVVLVDDQPDAVRHFWHSMVTTPPGVSRGWLPVTAMIALGRRVPWTWTGAVVPGRVVFGRRQ